MGKILAALKRAPAFKLLRLLRHVERNRSEERKKDQAREREEVRNRRTSGRERNQFFPQRSAKSLNRQFRAKGRGNTTGTELSRSTSEEPPKRGINGGRRRMQSVKRAKSLVKWEYADCPGVIGADFKKERQKTGGGEKIQIVNGERPPH